MALARRGLKGGEAPTWPGFVDALTSLLLVLLFVLTIFMVMQSVLSETIDSQSDELDALSQQVAGLADALGLERDRAARLAAEGERLGTALAAAEAEGDRQAALMATLSSQLQARQEDLAAAEGRIASFEAQVASLLAERDAARGEAGRLTASLAEIEAAQAQLLSEKQALDLALASVRREIDARAQAARLAAARREALEATIAEMQRQAAAQEVSLAQTLAALQAAEGQVAALTGREAAALAELRARDAALAEAGTRLEAAEAARLAEIAAAEALRARLAGAEAALSEGEKARLADLAAAEALLAKLAASDAELTAMTLALEEERRKAEETLTLLAAAEVAGETARGEASVQAGLLEAARKVVERRNEDLVRASRDMAVLNQQIAALRSQLGSLQALLDEAGARDASSKVQIEALGSQLNAALAQAAAEERKRADLEEAERRRLEAEAQDLARYRSEFFGKLSQLLAGREGVRVVGDRFVFSSEVLFQPGAADLSDEGKAQIAGVVATLTEIAEQIPQEIDWIIRVDGHTDDVPLVGGVRFADNWELSQARALSVVRYMQDELGFPPFRLAATGFGEWRPVALGDSDYARAQNRRIELKLTER